MARTADANEHRAAYTIEGRHFIVTLYEDGSDSSDRDQGFVVHVWARNHREAPKAALLALRKGHLSRLPRVSVWSSEARYWEEGNDP